MDLSAPGNPAAAPDPLLAVEDLHIHLHGETGSIPVVEGVDLGLERGATLGLVGESGCGKSLTALSVLGLLPRGLRREKGRILYRGRDLTGLGEKQLRRVRGAEIAMIFQEPMTSLNPVLTVGTQVGEGLRLHRGLGRRGARERSAELLREVGVPDPRRRLGSYPHELSGGLRQRVMIAMALACDPALLIADEPTTALDMTIQAQVLDKLGELKARRGLALLLITHDLGVVAEMAQRVLVMYAGQIVESATTAELFEAPLHPYTRALLESLPRVDRKLADARGIPGSVPRPGRMPTGCRFRERCALAEPACREAQPLRELGGGRLLRCWREEQS
jgi:oligopeptide/dipeptide ABC transporter ATP-binding protein